MLFYSISFFFTKLRKIWIIRSNCVVDPNRTKKYPQSAHHLLSNNFYFLYSEISVILNEGLNRLEYANLFSSALTFY